MFLIWELRVENVAELVELELEKMGWLSWVLDE
jgi:hypothetical protein